MTDRELRPALGALRTRVRALYLVHGTGRVAAALAGLLLLSFAMDVVLRPPLPVRVIHGLLSLAAFAWALMPPNPALESEMLTRLMVKFGMPEPAARAAVVQASIAPETMSRICCGRTGLVPTISRNSSP